MLTAAAAIVPSPPLPPPAATSLDDDDNKGTTTTGESKTEEKKFDTPEEEAAHLFIVAAEGATGRKLTAEQTTVVTAVFQGRNVVMIGPGGTGKSMLLEMLLKFWKAKSRFVTTVAPYGRAARNVDGVTIHSAFGLCVFGLKTTKKPQEFARYIQRCRPEVYATYTDTEILVIDEMGCMTPRNWQRVDAIARILRHAPLLPFGGMQVILSGDPYQAVPILDKEDLEPRADGKPVPHFIFQTQLWRQLKLVKVIFDKVFRQAKLADAQLLNAFRRGDLTVAHKKRLHECVRDIPAGENPTRLYFYNREVEAENRRQLALLSAPDVVFATDVKPDLSKLPRSVFDCNAALMRADGTCVNDPPAKKAATVKGGRGGRGGGRKGRSGPSSSVMESASDAAQAVVMDMKLAAGAWAKKQPEAGDDDDLLTDSWGVPPAGRDKERMHKLSQLVDAVFKEHPFIHKNLTLKVGARVMLRQNLHLKGGLVNGLIGTVMRAELPKPPPETAVGKRPPPPPTLRDAVLEVLWEDCPNYSAPFRVPVTTMRYGAMGVGFVELSAFPITLAWALSCDSAQGLAFNSLSVNLGERCRPHMAYVALSRARDLDRVYLTAWHPKCIVISSEVRDFMDEDANSIARKQISAFANALEKLPDPTSSSSSSSSKATAKPGPAKRKQPAVALSTGNMVKKQRVLPPPILGTGIELPDDDPVAVTFAATKRKPEQATVIQAAAKKPVLSVAAATTKRPLLPPVTAKRKLAGVAKSSTKPLHFVSAGFDLPDGDPVAVPFPLL